MGPPSVNRSRITRNAVANFAGFAATVAVTFFLTPFVIGSLGEVRYGVWTLMLSVTGYYGVLDVGLRGGGSSDAKRQAATTEQEDSRQTPVWPAEEG